MDTHWIILANSIVGLMTAVVGLIVLRMKKDVKETKEDIAETRLDVAEARADVHKIELATNSMKDALVAATGKEKFAAGKEEARLEGEAKAAALVVGAVEAKTPAVLEKLDVIAEHTEDTASTLKDIKETLPAQIEDRKEQKPTTNKSEKK